MTGYQEILTDPSYKGQIVTMTYPLIGNYGINRQDVESRQPHVAGFIIKELPPLYSNYRADMSLDEYLQAEQDRRHRGDRHPRADAQAADQRRDARRPLDRDPRRRRSSSTAPAAPRRWPGPTGCRRSSRRAEYDWDQDQGDWRLGKVERGDGLHVVALDCGAKHNILRHLAERGVKVTVLPPDTTAEEILQAPPRRPVRLQRPRRSRGARLRGEADPGACSTSSPSSASASATSSSAGPSAPSTYKLKFGHRGGNQPVKNLDTGRVEITSQNHGFAVDQKSLEASGGVVTHVNLNDDTVEGFRHAKLPVFSVQYHPEASPGPHDAAYLFDAFVEMMKTKKPPTRERLKELQAMREKAGATR